jgi:ribosomal protein S18 acetylase RimI-like enzyme
MYTVRSLTAADRVAFRALRHTAVTLNPGDFMITAEEQQQIPRLSIESALEQPSSSSFFLGAFAGPPDELVAMAGLITGSLLKTRHVGHLASVFVHPKVRRHGVARMLVERILSQAADTGLHAVRLEVVAENRAAVALYESLGFVAYGREPAAYRLGERCWDLLLMTRDCGRTTPPSESSRS